MAEPRLVGYTTRGEVWYAVLNRNGKWAPYWREVITAGPKIGTTTKWKRIPPDIIKYVKETDL